MKGMPGEVDTSLMVRTMPTMQMILVMWMKTILRRRHQYSMVTRQGSAAPLL